MHKYKYMYELQSEIIYNIYILWRWFGSFSKETN